MANWCLSVYIFEGAREEVEDLLEKLTALQQREISLVENGFGKNWLGNVVKVYGGDPESIECRGSYESPVVRDGVLVVDTETAWNEMRPTWDFVCQQYKTLRYYFKAEESGNEYYVTNDADKKYFPERYILEQNEADTEYFETETAFFAAVAERTGTKINSWDTMQEAIENYNADDEDDCPIMAGAFEVVD